MAWWRIDAMSVKIIDCHVHLLSEKSRLYWERVGAVISMDFEDFRRRSEMNGIRSIVTPETIGEREGYEHENDAVFKMVTSFPKLFAGSLYRISPWKMSKILQLQGP
jgi:hypothetical protein